MIQDLAPESIDEPKTKPRRMSQRDREKLRELRRRERLRTIRTESRGFAKIFATQISNDHGITWKIFAICDKCIKSAEPPTRIKNEGPASAMNCDLCGAYNEEYKSKL